jgi:hypothetical protein
MDDSGIVVMTVESSEPKSDEDEEEFGSVLTVGFGALVLLFN